MSRLSMDVRFGLRALSRSRGFALAAIATLSVGIGGAVAAFSVVNGVLLTPLSVPDPEGLVSISLRYSDEDFPSEPVVTVLKHLEEETGVFEGISTISSQSADRYRDGVASLSEFVAVTGPLFELLRVQPALGRVFAPEEVLPDGTRPALISYGYWQEEWSASPTVIGEIVEFEQRGTRIVTTIIGVLPDGFQNPLSSSQSDVWVSTQVPAETTDRIRPGPKNIGRLRTGQDIRSAQAAVDTVSVSLSATYPALRADSTAPVRLKVDSLLETIVGGNARRAIAIFVSAVASVLLICVLNLASLQASRISRREREMSIRSALGASRLTLVRQVIVESILLTTLGGIVGFLLAFALQRVVLETVPEVLPRWDSIAVDERAMFFALALVLLTGLMVGIGSVLRAARKDLSTRLNEGSTKISETRLQSLFRSVLIVVQTSLAAALMVGAGLLIHSFGNLLAVDIGIEPDDLVIATVDLPRNYNVAARAAFAPRVLESIRGLPDSREATVANFMPFFGSVSALIEVEHGDSNVGHIQEIYDSYGDVVGTPLLRGRWITAEDIATGAAVAVVSQSASLQYWAGEDPIGRRIRPPGDAEARWYSVVGVVGDIRTSYELDPPYSVYFPFASIDTVGSRPQMTVAVRTEQPNAEVLKGRILEVEPSASVSVWTMNNRLHTLLAARRLQTGVMTAFGVFATLLAMLGVFSVVASCTAQRTREAGIRIALGAHPEAVVWLMMRRGLLPACLGLLIGLLTALGLTRFLESYLYETEPTDPFAYVGVLWVILVATFVASWLSARHAAEADPLVALRHE